MLVLDIMLERIKELLGEDRGAGKQLAEVLGVSAQLITNWKSGRVRSYSKYAGRIADYYDVSLDWLCGKTDIKEKPLVHGDERLTEVLELYQTRSDIRILFGTLAGASPESVMRAAMQIEADRGGIKDVDT